MASAIETINQLASSAAKAVWGDSNAEAHKEPISGATGDVAKGEPYDAGNLDAEDQRRVESNLSSEGDKSTPDDDLADDDHYALSSSAKDQAPPFASETQGPKETKESKEAKDSSNVNDDPEQGKPLDELTGQGPRPIEVVAKEHGGNAAAIADDEADSSSSPSAPEQKKKKLDADNEQQDDDKERDAAAEAEYVKTTGLAADGGDFDAAKPGAGREADRLMEQKGLKTEEPDNKAAGGSSSSSNSNSHGHGRKSSDSSGHHKDKPSLGERIKNKLHRH